MVTKPKNKSSIRVIPIFSRLTKTMTNYFNKNDELNLFSYWSNQTVKNNLRRMLKTADRSSDTILWFASFAYLLPLTQQCGHRLHFQKSWTL